MVPARHTSTLFISGCCLTTMRLARRFPRPTKTEGNPFRALRHKFGVWGLGLGFTVCPSDKNTTPPLSLTCKKKCGTTICRDDPPLTTLVPSSQDLGSPECASRSPLAAFLLIALRPGPWSAGCTVAFLIVTQPEICFQKYYFSYRYLFGLFSNFYFLDLPLLRLCRAPHTTYVADVFVCGTDSRSRCKWGPAGRKTHFAIRTNDKCVSGKIIAIFLDRGFLT